MDHRHNLGRTLFVTAFALTLLAHFTGFLWHPASRIVSEHHTATTHQIVAVADAAGNQLRLPIALPLMAMGLCGLWLMAPRRPGSLKPDTAGKEATQDRSGK